MSNSITICFAGHSQIVEDKEEILEDLKEVLRKIISDKDKVTFLCGTYGDFDTISTKAVSELKEEYADSKEILLYVYVPYHERVKYVAGEEFYKGCDMTVVADIAPNVPKKLCILKTNEQMVEHSDMVVCYILNQFGGAYKTCRFAEKRGKAVLNIAVK